jgi:riboflavin synthase
VFTGIVTEVGTVEASDRTEAGARLRIVTGLAAKLRGGDSIAVSGACLTASRISDDAFEADVMNQTLSLTTLGGLAPGDRVNLEPALRAGEPLGGHLMQGHVDGTGVVASVSEDGIARRMRVVAPEGLRRYVVERGSVAVDGVSLTVASLDPEGFEVSLIPETLQRTTLAAAGEGARVNLEVDIVARYTERLLSGFGGGSNG